MSEASSTPLQNPPSILKRVAQKRSTLAFVLVVPLLAVVIGLVIYPFFYSIFLSLLNKKETAFVGLQNYRDLLSTPTFWMVLRQSILFALTAVFFKAIIGFVMAHLINVLPNKRQRIWRGLALVPWVMPPVLSTLSFLWLFDTSHGALNWVLKGLFGIDIPWLGEPFWARFSVILVNIWYGSPFFLIMYLAGLKSVPQDLYEAAEIDGASRVQRLWYVTLPMMGNIIAITMLFSTIVTFANFDIVRVLTAGGPRNTTHLFGTYSFVLGIESGNIPQAAAVSLFMFPLLAVLAFIILRKVRERVADL